MKVQKIAELQGHLDSIYALSPALDENYFYSAGGDGYIAQWDFRNLKDAQLLVRVPASVYAFCLVKALKLLLIGQRNGGLHFVDLESKKEIKLIQVSKKAIFDIQYFQEKIYCSDGEGKISIFNSRNFNLENQIHSSEKSARTLAIHPNRKELMVGYSDNKIRIFDLKETKLLKTLNFHKSSVFDLQFSPENKQLISASRDAHLNIWDVENNFKLLKQIPAHLFTINSLSFSPDGKYFATGSRDKTIKIWNSKSIELLKVIDLDRHQAHKNSVNKVYWHFNNFLISASDDRKIMLWKIEE